ncbi:ABC transporter ATP-binding protein [Sneathiella chinensis]|uniref:ABC transporter ATP-binding protein n=1 Tax=Sneathiella chinensis TaxID=349750 RepID=A0ABQ5U7T0_9PROT|nr:oligopeptide/dipeptide ABC transporter ATP-binding protein [Sneathiella chinensis]GLQ07377.1 ABC transporter ATP-binding protein [Sneathiella chinensis]
MPEQVAVQVDSLKVYFDVSPPLVTRLLNKLPRQYLKAVDDLSFSITKGQTFSLVGESGCGKSTVARSVAGLCRIHDGQITINGTDADLPAARQDQRDAAEQVQMIFQSPYASLNPRWRVRDIVAEPIRAFKLARDKADERQQVARLLEQVGLSASDGEKYPHEFSGGQRQRISIARALSSRPKFLICDEPTSALDVSVQAQILNLMTQLQDELGLTYLFISHDLAVIDHMSDWVGVMYLGRICEITPKSELFANPRHPYTRMLLATVPDLQGKSNRPTITGEVPNPITPPTGCYFHPRCPHAEDRCRSERPTLQTHGPTRVACHAVQEKRL